MTVKPVFDNFRALKIDMERNGWVIDAFISNTKL